jgi:RNA-binding protein
MSLTGKQRQHLRALAHHLEPVVQVGHEGLSEAVVLQIEQALVAHELIKLRVAQESPVSRDEVADELFARGIGEIAQTIGRIVVVWKRRPKKPKIELKKVSRASDGKPKTRLSGKGRSKGAPHLKAKAKSKAPRKKNPGRTYPR